MKLTISYDLEKGGYFAVDKETGTRFHSFYCGEPVQRFNPQLSGRAGVRTRERARISLREHSPVQSKCQEFISRYRSPKQRPRPSPPNDKNLMTAAGMQQTLALRDKEVRQSKTLELPRLSEHHYVHKHVDDLTHNQPRGSNPVDAKIVREKLQRKCLRRKMELSEMAREARHQNRHFYVSD